MVEIKDYPPDKEDFDTGREINLIIARKVIPWGFPQSREEWGTTIQIEGRSGVHEVNYFIDLNDCYDAAEFLCKNYPTIYRDYSLLLAQQPTDSDGLAHEDLPSHVRSWALAKAIKDRKSP